MTDKEFEIKKKQHLLESKFTAWIKIDNGDTFEGTAEMLDDCFGVDLDGLDSWCSFNNMEYTVDNIDPFTL